MFNNYIEPLGVLLGLDDKSVQESLDKSPISSVQSDIVQQTRTPVTPPKPWITESAPISWYMRKANPTQPRNIDKDLYEALDPGSVYIPGTPGN